MNVFVYIHVLVQLLNIRIIEYTEHPVCHDPEVMHEVRQNMTINTVRKLVELGSLEFLNCEITVVHIFFSFL